MPARRLRCRIPGGRTVLDGTIPARAVLRVITWQEPAQCQGACAQRQENQTGEGHVPAHGQARARSGLPHHGAQDRAQGPCGVEARDDGGAPAPLDAQAVGVLGHVHHRVGPAHEQQADREAEPGAGVAGPHEGHGDNTHPQAGHAGRGEAGDEPRRRQPGQQGPDAGRGHGLPEGGLGQLQGGDDLRIAGHEVRHAQTIGQEHQVDGDTGADELRGGSGRCGGRW